MRLGIKSMLLLLAAYAVLIAAFALGVDRWLHAFEDTVVLETARLFAREEAALLADRSLGALQMPDDKSRSLLRQKIQDLTLLSEVVSSISVIGGDGRVVASDRWPVGRPAPRPEVVFAGGREVRPRPGQGRRFFKGGDYALDVPLVEKGRLVGYIEVELQSGRVASLFSAARRQLLTTAVAGLLGVLLLGGALQFEIARGAAAIARTLEDAIRAPGAGSGPRRADEFGRALTAAGNVRQALSQARQESSRLHESFRALAQVTKMGVLLLRSGRQPDFANARALELLGLPSLDELRERWPSYRERFAPVLAAVGMGPEPAPLLEIELPGPGATKLRVEPYRLGGVDREEYLVLMNDPEVLDALETDVRLANQLQGLARVYRTVAHEVRAPLSAMMIHLDLLRESMAAGGATKEGREGAAQYVVVLREELERLNRSLSDVLTQTLPSTDQRDRFDLRDALRELGTLLAPQARRQGVTFRTRLPESPVLLVGFRDRLKQSFLNIAVNALEAMPAGGQMSLEMDVEDSHVTVRVSDTGRGIPKDALTHIYERDFTTKGTGSGIGLHVARALVELHGGEIRVESQEDRGTLVEVRLPIVPRD